MSVTIEPVFRAACECGWKMILPTHHEAALAADKHVAGAHKKKAKK